MKPSNSDESEACRLLTDDICDKSKIQSEQTLSARIHTFSFNDLSIQDLDYAINAFWRTALAVAVTITLSTFAVIFIEFDNNDDSNPMTVYNLSEGSDGSKLTDSQKLGESMVNAIVIVGFVCIFTFVIVIFYWLKCTKCLVGYMIFSSSVLLALVGGIFCLCAIDTFQIPMDIGSFTFVLYNFAVVGVISIFYSNLGIPEWATQGYLISTSVILSWQLSRLDDWTVWSLLIMLSLYDLCAVLTPCGPLNALVLLMRDRPNEPLPGLLYEANIPSSEIRVPEATKVDHSTPDKERKTKLISNKYSSTSSDKNRKDASGLDAGQGDIELANCNLLERDFKNKNAISDTPKSEKGEFQFPNQKGDKAEGITNRSTISSHGNVIDEEDDEQEHIKSVKLGLGDFVFYSVLVSRAAKAGFVTFLVSFVAVLSGLGLTLFLLTVYKKALPALPISITLGVILYFAARFFLLPFLTALNEYSLCI